MIKKLLQYLWLDYISYYFLISIIVGIILYTFKLIFKEIGIVYILMYTLLFIISIFGLVIKSIGFVYNIHKGEYEIFHIIGASKKKNDNAYFYCINEKSGSVILDIHMNAKKLKKFEQEKIGQIKLYGKKKKYYLPEEILVIIETVKHIIPTN